MILFHLFESCFKSGKHRIAFFTSAICFKILQPVCRGGSGEQDVDTGRRAVSHCPSRALGTQLLTLLCPPRVSS